MPDDTVYTERTLSGLEMCGFALHNTPRVIRRPQSCNGVDCDATASCASSWSPLREMCDNLNPRKIGHITEKVIHR